MTLPLFYTGSGLQWCPGSVTSSWSVTTWGVGRGAPPRDARRPTQTWRAAGGRPVLTSAIGRRRAATWRSLTSEVDLDLVLWVNGLYKGLTFRKKKSYCRGCYYQAVTLSKDIEHFDILSVEIYFDNFSFFIEPIIECTQYKLYNNKYSFWTDIQIMTCSLFIALWFF